MLWSHCDHGQLYCGPSCSCAGRRETLKQLMQDAQAQVQALKLEVADDPGAGTRRVGAARQRAAAEREQRIVRAIEAMDELDKSVAGKRKIGRASWRDRVLASV